MDLREVAEFIQEREGRVSLFGTFKYVGLVTFLECVYGGQGGGAEVIRLQGIVIYSPVIAV